MTPFPFPMRFPLPARPRRQAPRAGSALLIGLLGLPVLAAPARAEVDRRPSPALPPLAGVKPAATATLPSQPPGLGLPTLENRVSCPALQQRIATTVGQEASVWSISVADGSGRLLADLNGTTPRVPASNQKLVTTAFALHRLGPDHRLATQLWRLNDGTLRLTGQGDPDLAPTHLRRFARLAMASGSGSDAANPTVRLEVAEESRQNWWPSDWAWADRSYAYGAPITRLALMSNETQPALGNPPSHLVNLLQRALAAEGSRARVTLVSARQPMPAEAVLVHEEPSTSMHGLLSLANTESHNFTAEVLLRQASGSWDVTQASRTATLWLREQGLPMQGIRVADGSGLSRSNRLTSRFLAALLLRMDHHPYGRAYLGSMAVAGQRGTLRNLYKGSSLDGRLFAKTGTLTGVRSISGVLRTSDGPRYVSAIANGAWAPNTTIGKVMRQVQNVSLCQVGS
jgi:D-alanyl-D-alanine carboxypeptidase/D-alanyl-D-alanine-endopeptidase (penicillin-binding protein 4)